MCYKGGRGARLRGVSCYYIPPSAAGSSEKSKSCKVTCRKFVFAPVVVGFKKKKKLSKQQIMWEINLMLRSSGKGVRGWGDV